jgi:hypothetical protein
MNHVALLYFRVRISFIYCSMLHIASHLIMDVVIGVAVEILLIVIYLRTWPGNELNQLKTTCEHDQGSRELGSFFLRGGFPSSIS